MVVVAPGEPGMPDTPCASAETVAHAIRLEAVAMVESFFMATPQVALAATSNSEFRHASAAF